MNLRNLADKSWDSAQSRRLSALAMILESQSREDASRQAGMDRQTLRNGVLRYNKLGAPGLVSRTEPGPATKLSDGQMQELRALVISGADVVIHKVVRWRCVDLRGEITRCFCVTVAERTSGKWLRRLCLTRLQPRPVHSKKDPAAEEAFEKTSVFF